MPAMCLIVFAWRPAHKLALVVAANRDEFYARATLPLAAWADAPWIVAGRDLQAGGSWLGVTQSGRFAALTNIREKNRGQPGKRSRGELVAGFLRGQHSPADYLAEVARHLDDYAGFNLLVGDLHELHYLNARQGQPQKLKAGIYGLSNAALNTPWPKLERCRAALGKALEQDEVPTEALFSLLADRQQAADKELPDTGLTLDFERLLSSPFIASRSYGTRASTVLLRRIDGSMWLGERRFGEGGGYLGENSFTLS